MSDVTICWYTLLQPSIEKRDVSPLESTHSSICGSGYAFHMVIASSFSYSTENHSVPYILVRSLTEITRSDLAGLVSLFAASFQYLDLLALLFLNRPKMAAGILNGGLVSD